MTRHEKIPSQLRRLSPPTTDDEIRDRRWWRLWQHGVAEIDVDRIACPTLRENIIRECRRQNGRAVAENLPAERVHMPKTATDGRKVLKPLYGQKNGHSVEIEKEASK